MKYREFTLDPFQEQAIQSIDKNHSVVVSAATGTGKTLIADYVINKAIQEEKRAVYTAPIKALSNQKFREFTTLYGKQAIGLLTGDIVINPQAQILIMTTEIYRNMLLEKSPDIQTISYVIFDEIHYINDRERGTVWEESIIFSPENVRFLCLSATIPNYKQFAQWIEFIKHHTVDTVNYMKRAVPLEHSCYDFKFGITSIDKIIKDTKQERFVRRNKKNKRQALPVPNHIHLIKELHEEQKLPAIFFSFSRAQCEKRAVELAKKHDFTNPAQKKEIIQITREMISDTIRDLHSTHQLKAVLQKGIGIHHAGMLAKQKEIVEHLFDKGLLKVLYATETFAVGINMPAKSVCFSSLQKYDGLSFRLLDAKEYFQLAGRAGRRGIDTVGYAIALIDRNQHEDFEQIKQLTTKDEDGIISRYQLSYNTVLNLIKQFDEQQIQQILKQNFGYFVKQQSKQQFQITQSFANYKTNLEKLGFLENGQLTWKGEFATRIYTSELEIAELVFGGYLENLSDPQIATLLGSIIYEPRRMDHFNIKGVQIDDILHVISDNKLLNRKIKKLHLKRVRKTIESWVRQKDFEYILDLSNLAEGDIIRIFRQLVDILRQIKGSLLATEPHNPLVERINTLLEKIDRDIVSVEL
ncbi:MAG: DEAD/DEAH box helicase [Candidatus Woesearchaeota archaeon]